MVSEGETRIGYSFPFHFPINSNCSEEREEEGEGEDGEEEDAAGCVSSSILNHKNYNNKTIKLKWINE